MRLKQEREAAEKENEVKLRVELLATYEDERLQRLSAHKQRLKMAQHKKDVQVIIVKRQRLKHLDIGLEDKKLSEKAPKTLKAMMIASAVL